MSRVICIVGMHRSGTSALTGALQEAGLSLGSVSTWNQFNQKGNREHPAINQLNDRILSDNGGTWEQPPAAVHWQREHREQRDAIIAGFAGTGVWGFKDPRTLLTLAGWREALPDADFVGSFRNPGAVALSLASRNGFSVEQGLSLWERYNEKLLDLFVVRPFPLVSFDLPADDIVQSTRRAIEMLGLAAAATATPFFDERLRHVKPDDTPLPRSIAALYQRLRERAITV